MPSYSTVCLDTSLIVRMYDPESIEHPQVEALWDRWLEQRVRLVAPTLMRYELTNAVFRPVRLGRGEAERALDIIRSVEQLPIQYFESVDLNVAAFELALSLQLTAAYDAHYIALAMQERAALYTADKRLAAASAKYSFVRYVMDETDN